MADNIRSSNSDINIRSSSNDLSEQLNKQDLDIVSLRLMLRIKMRK